MKQKQKHGGFPESKSRPNPLLDNPEELAQADAMAKPKSEPGKPEGKKGDKESKT